MASQGPRRTLVEVKRALLRPRKKLKPALRPSSMIPASKWSILRGDKVEVINGPCEGQKGTVKDVIRKMQRVVVDGVNMRMRNVRAGEGKKQVMLPCALHVSNVALLCPETNLPTKIRRQFLEDGTKVRVSKRSGAVIPRPAILRERRNPRPMQVGPKDTAKEDVEKVTFKGLDSFGKEIR